MKARRYRFTFLLLPLFCICLAHAAQGIKGVSAAEAATHLVKSVKAQYPPMASRARIQGDVVLLALITETGDVSDIKAVSGHPLLLPAAIQAVEQYKYEPFLENNHAVTVQTTIKVGFFLADSPLENEFQRVSSACQLAIERQQFAEGEKPCNRAAEIAKELPAGFDRYRFAAFGNAGIVATRLNKPVDAARHFEQQVTLSQESPQFIAGANMVVLDARLNLARAFQSSGDLQKADSAYTAAEKAIQSSQNDLRSGRLHISPAEQAKSFSESLKQAMKQTLEEHAALLRQMGRQSKAEELEQREKSLVAD